MKNIPLARPILGFSEKYAVLRILNSGSLAQGKEVQSFEEEFSKFVEERPCVAVNSGTSALHLAMLSLGIGPGDEVITTSFTFAATANAISLTGATPVFVDINPHTFNINPDKIVSKITKKTKAILVVHLYGLPSDMSSIVNIALTKKLLLIEDAAQAHLATVDGQPVGTFGDAAIFSFYPTKNMTSGEGGMIVLKDNSAERICRLLRNQGMETRYKNEIVGFNLRMTDIHAAIGRKQLMKLPRWTEKRRQLAQDLSSRLRGSVIPYEPVGYKHVYHQYTLRIKANRDLFSQELTNMGIGNGVYYPIPVHKLPAFSSKLLLPETDLASKQAISIPVHPSLKKRDVNKIVSSINRLLDKGTFGE
jgi:dTDP-4-amino-4,6-dideoxygalactose transaminase